MAISVARAAAAALRSCGAMIGVLRLPNVPMSNGTRAVSAITSSIEATGTLSSSATDCTNIVRVF